MLPDLSSLSGGVSRLKIGARIGRVIRINSNRIEVRGLSDIARIGDDIVLKQSHAEDMTAQVVRIEPEHIVLLPEGVPEGLKIGDRALHLGERGIAPDDSWLGRVIDPRGQPLDGRPISQGAELRSIHASPPLASMRRPLGERMSTGLLALNTLLPIVSGQRIGLFAGSGVGKSMMLAQLARSMDADVIVVALIGERGREVREFVQNTLGAEGMKRSVVVAATSDRSALLRRSCAMAAMTIAEYFRDKGLQVLFLSDSITRFAEAHREIAVAAGEPASLRGFPASTSQQIMKLCERAGTGAGEDGDISAVMTVLVEGSDFEGPIADILRGVLDGHIVLNRDIAERGRYPAIDVLRSVSRSLPMAASESENQLIAEVRKLLGLYERSEVMIQSGLYAPGSDPQLDRAVKHWPAIDAFIGQTGDASIAESFLKLRTCMAEGPNTPV